jgi:hypothetical protein
MKLFRVLGIAFRNDVKAIMPTPNPGWTEKAAATKVDRSH